MMRIALIVLAALFLCAPVAGAYSADVLLNTGYSFQDEGTTWFDDTAKLASLDGSWGPTKTGTVTNNYYATGTAPDWFDGISANFNLSNIGYQNVRSVTVKAYIKTGAYSDHNWHHYELYAGAFNPADQDIPPAAYLHSFGYSTYLSGGWITHDVPLGWITGNSLDLTLRLWNASVDQVKLEVEAVPVPPSLLLLGAGLVGVFLARRKAEG